MSVAIEGPIGPFLIPSEPPETMRICAGLSRGVWGSPGRYDTPDAGLPEYEHAALSIPNVRVVLDVGAGWGAFAVWAIARWGRSISLRCYEPSDIAVDFIRANVPGDVDWRIVQAAVSAASDVTLHRSEDWGCRKISVGGDGEAVTTIHPADLPPCDILKCDAEGIEPELFSLYPHLATVKAAIYEWHTPEHREVLRRICTDAGLVCVRDDDGPWGPGNGVGVWVHV